MSLTEVQVRVLEEGLQTHYCSSYPILLCDRCGKLEGHALLWCPRCGEQYRRLPQDITWLDLLRAVSRRGLQDVSTFMTPKHAAQTFIWTLEGSDLEEAAAYITRRMSEGVL